MVFHAENDVILPHGASIRQRVIGMVGSQLATAVVFRPCILDHHDLLVTR